MEKKCGEEKWASVNLAENAAVNVHQEEEDEEEALSLCDLPLIHNSRKEKEKEDKEEESSIPLSAIEAQEDFDFCSLLKESEMCAADEVFFQGQILPLRHSVSSEKGLLQYCGSNNGSRASISRSESLDCYSSRGLISSRSSSISSSHQSSSSGSSSTTTTPPKHKLPKPPQNHFHSHPSPSPRIKFPNNRRGIINNNRINSANKSSSSSVWNIFRLGLVTTPPEIAFQDLKTRCPNNTNSKNFGSRNSTSSNASSSISNNSNNKINNPEKKRKPRALLGGCKCSIDAVDTVRSRSVNIKKSGSTESEILIQAVGVEEGNVGAVEPMKSQKHQAAKKQLSHHRTFEWLKQLSLEATADEA